VRRLFEDQHRRPTTRRFQGTLYDDAGSFARLQQLRGIVMGFLQYLQLLVTHPNELRALIAYACVLARSA
jgi:hypothetical protein